MPPEKGSRRKYAEPLSKYLDPTGPLVLPQVGSTVKSTAIVLIDMRALDRILAKVGQRFVPTNLDRIALRDAIEKAVKAKEIVDKSRPGTRSKAIGANAKRIREALKSLYALLRENSDVYELITQSAPSISDDILRWMVIARSVEQTWDLHEDVKRRYPRFPSPREWLAGVELPLIFEDCFHREARRSRSGKKPSGPTVQFVAAVMTEIAMPFTAESVVRAMTRLAELRNRRRAVRNNDSPNIGQK